MSADHDLSTGVAFRERTPYGTVTAIFHDDLHGLAVFICDSDAYYCRWPAGNRDGDEPLYRWVLDGRDGGLDYTAHKLGAQVFDLDASLSAARELFAAGGPVEPPHTIGAMAALYLLNDVHDEQSLVAWFNEIHGRLRYIEAGDYPGRMKVHYALEAAWPGLCEQARERARR